MRGPTGRALHGRRAFRARRLPSIALAVVAFVAAGGILLGPVGMRAAAAEALRYDLTDAADGGRLDLAAQSSAPLEVGGGSAAPADSPVAAAWGGLLGALADLRDAQPSVLRAALGEGSAAGTLDAVPVAPIAGAETVRASQLSLSATPDLVERISGTPVTDMTRIGADGAFPIALSSAVAAEMEWRAGEERLLVLPPGGVQAVVLGEIFEPTDAGDRLWTHIGDALTPNLLVTGDGGTIARGVGFVDAALWPEAQQLPVPVTTVAWFPVAADSPSVDTAGSLSAAVRVFASSPQVLLGAPYTFRTDLPDALDGAGSRQTEADVLTVTAIAAPAVLLVVAAALLLGALRDARAPGTAVLRGRGLSRAQSRSVLLVETAIAVGTGAALGAIVSTPLIVTAGPPAATIAGSCTALAVALVAILAGAALLAPASGQTVPRRARGGRVAAEALLVVLTGMSVVAVLSGVATAAVRILVPVLVVLCVGAAAVRIAEPLTGALRHRAARGPGTAVLVGSRAVPRALVIGTVAALTITVLCASQSHTIREATIDEAWASVGADVAVRGAGLPRDAVDRILEADGVEAGAGVVVDQPVTITTNSARSQARLVVVDTTALRRVQADRPHALALPAGLETAASDGSMPVVASAAAVAQLGDAFSLRGHALRVAGTGPDTVPLTSAHVWILVDIEAASALVETSGVADPLLLRTASPTVLPAVRDLAGADATVTTPAEEAAAVLGGPRDRVLQGTLTGAGAVSLLLAALLLVLTQSDAGPRRRRRDRSLVALGVPRGRRAAIVVWESVPAVVVAVVAAAIAGATLPAALIPLVDPGGTGTIGVRLDVLLGVVALGAYTVVAGGVLAIAALLASSRRRSR